MKQKLGNGTLYTGDCLEVMKTLESESVNCVVTSPPYWALRDYGMKEQLGLEPTFKEYIDKLCNIFDEVKRVLRKDGTCWVVIGDTYGGSGNASGHKEETKNLGYKTSKMGATKGITQKLLPKCLLGIPFRFSLEMMNRGWILRNTLIWHKPNCMPCSVKDRFTVDFEYVFFFVKNKKYWFETQYEPHKSFDDYKRRKIKEKKGNTEHPRSDLHCDNEGNFRDRKDYYGEQGRNKRCIWKITTKPFKDSHFAVFPEELIETPIKAGCPESGVVLDPFIGSGTTALVSEKLNRRWIGIELNPEYVEIAKKRISPYVGQERLKLGDEKCIRKGISSCKSMTAVGEPEYGMRNP